MSLLSECKTGSFCTFARRSALKVSCVTVFARIESDFSKRGAGETA